MFCVSFLYPTSKQIQIWFWNINGLRNKLENAKVVKWINEHDIVVLSEIHCGKVSHAPDFIPVVASNPLPNDRGGLVILFSTAI